MDINYDDLPYKSNPFIFLSIEKLEALAILYGLTPVDSRKAKVLELGSSFGGNILGQAIYKPYSEFIGVDLSEKEIEIGNEIINKLKLENIKLYSKNILDIDENFGKFDYIIVHGVYSWVPNEVKEKIISICNKNLSENGIAFISYNTYPGWKEKENVKELMKYVNKYFPNEEILEKVNRSKIVLKEFSDELKNLSKIYDNKKNFVNLMEEVIFQENKSYLGHEYLGTFNDPIYFHEFIDKIQKNDLEYFTDINLNLSFVSQYPEGIKNKIRKLSGNNKIVKEQCLDFILDTSFRRSLLCKKSQLNKLNFSEGIPNEVFDKFYYKSFISKSEFEEVLEISLNEKTKEILRYFYDKEFNIEEIKTYCIEKEKIGLEETNQILKSVRAVLLLFIIESKIDFYVNKTKEIKFEENKTYIDKKVADYILTIDKDYNNHLGIADYRNTTTTFLEAEIELIEVLKEPKTKENLLDVIKKYNIRRKENDTLVEIDKPTFLEDVLKKFFILKLFRKKN